MYASEVIQHQLLSFHSISITIKQYAVYSVIVCCNMDLSGLYKRMLTQNVISTSSCIYCIRHSDARLIHRNNRPLVLSNLSTIVYDLICLFWNRTFLVFYSSLCVYLWMLFCALTLPSISIKILEFLWCLHTKSHVSFICIHWLLSHIPTHTDNCCCMQIFLDAIKIIMTFVDTTWIAFYTYQ